MALSPVSPRKAGTELLQLSYERLLTQTKRISILAEGRVPIGFELGSVDRRMAPKKLEPALPKLTDDERPVVLDRVKSLRSEIKGLQEQTPNSPQFKQWSHAVWTLVRQYSDFDTHKTSFGFLSFSSERSIPLVPSYGEPKPSPEDCDSQVYRSALLDADGILSVMIQQLEDADRARGGTRAIVVTAEPDPIDIVVNLCRRFHRVVRQIRQRHDQRTTLEVSDEYDVQDLVHALLALRFDDIRPEECTASYAGGSSRMDFLLWEERISLEVKKTRQTLRDREVGNQLIEDIARYGSHSRCKVLVCFVYDPEERLQNPRGLENDLSGIREGLDVRVVIEPRH